MAIEFDASSTDINAISVAHTVTNTGRGRVLIVGYQSDTDPTPITASYGGENMTVLESTVSGSNYRYVFYLFDPPTGSNTLSVSDTGTRQVIVASSFTGVDTESEAKAFGTVETASDTDGSHTDTVTSQEGQLVLSIILHDKGTSGAVDPVAVTESDQTLITSVENGESSAAGLSSSPGATTVTVGWTYDAEGEGQSLSFAMKPASPPRERTTWGATNTYASRMEGRPVVIDSLGREVPLEQIPVDVWMQFDGPFFPTTVRYLSFQNDPRKGYVEASNVSNANSSNARARISVRKESQFDFIMRRLTGGV